MTVEQWLNNNELSLKIWNNKYRNGNETFEEWLDRISAQNKEIRELILQKKFIFGGRILANRGVTDRKVTYSNCFLAGTKVLTKDGYKNIEDVEAGEYVYSHTNKWNRVNEVLSRPYTGTICKVTAPNLLSPIFCTPNHKFLTRGEWKPIEEFVIKNDNPDTLTGADGDIDIFDIEFIPDQDTIVYNLSVEEDHSYMVNGVFVHNCYVINPPDDNIESIFDCASRLARTFSYGGGCGIDLSQLRPRGARTNNAAKESSGAVSFMDVYSSVTGTIAQNGRRK